MVLSLKADESIVFDFSQMTNEELLALRGQRIIHTLNQIRVGPDGTSTRNGYLAPKCVRIVRANLFERKTLKRRSI